MGIRGRALSYLGASGVATLLALLTLPLTTRILGPREYGIFALATTIAGIGGALSTLGVGYLFANRWLGSSHEERVAMTTTVTAIAAVIAAVWAIAATSVFLGMRDTFATFAEVPLDGLLLAMAACVLSPPWAVAGTILIVEGRAAFSAGITALKAVATAATTLVCLFVFDLGVLALFAGLLADAIIGLAAGVFVLRGYLGRRFDRHWRRQLSQGSFLLAQGAESGQPLLERILLSRFAGFGDLGLYIHSQRYRQLALQATNAFGQAVWPVTLAEAAEPDGAFPITERTWNAVHVGVTAGALGLVALGDRLISVLTNGKFTQAWVFLAPWFVMLLLQLSAKPAVGTLYAFARGSTVARVSVVANVCGLALDATLIPVFGTWGAVLALLGQTIVYRLVVLIPAHRIRRVPFQDGWVIVGIVLLLATFAVKEILGLGLGGSLVLLAAVETLLLGLAWRVVLETARIGIRRPRLA